MSEALSDVMNGRQRYYLDAMGIQVWALREDEPQRDKVQGERAKESVEQTSPDLEPSSNPVPVNIATLDWAALQQRVQGCTLCPELAASHCRTVFGRGNRDVDWLVIGETPSGSAHDESSEPFSEQALRLLNAMFAAIGLRREHAYLTTALKCLPPGNREPAAEEITACADYLQRQIELLQPRIILAAGHSAAQSVLSTDVPFETLRGKVHRLKSGVPVVVTCSLEALLRSMQDKRKAWTDLCLAHATLLAVNEPKV